MKLFNFEFEECRETAILSQSHKEKKKTKGRKYPTQDRQLIINTSRTPEQPHLLEQPCICFLPNPDKNEQYKAILITITAKISILILYIITYYFVESMYNYFLIYFKL